LELLSIDKLKKFSVPTMLQFLVTIDRFQLPDLWPNCVDDADTEDLSLAIVPYQPSLHAVMISIWASAQPRNVSPPFLMLSQLNLLNTQVNT
jgi:hypothetical protein